MSAPRINIPALFQSVVTQVATELDRAVYFDYGKLKEVTRKLTQKDMGITTGNKKYPLIWLVMNYAETYGNQIGFCELADITIMICSLTQPQLTTQQRMAVNFVPTLYPIYDSFINQLEESGYFDHEALEFEHTKIDCPFWNEDMLKGDYDQFNDFIDAIQIRGMKLIVNESTCSRFKLLAA